MEGVFVCFILGWGLIAGLALTFRSSHLSLLSKLGLCILLSCLPRIQGLLVCLVWFGFCEAELGINKEHFNLDSKYKR